MLENADTEFIFIIKYLDESNISFASFIITSLEYYKYYYLYFYRYKDDKYM